MRPSHAGSWTITLRQTASGTADTCRVRFACIPADVLILPVSHLHSFQQLLQCAPWVLTARSISLCSALHLPSQRNASAGGHPACPGITLPMAEQSCPPCPKECYRAVFHTFIIWQAACPRGFLMPLLALCEALCLIIRRGKGHSVSIFLPRLKEKS